jgi:hypothetical protein
MKRAISFAMGLMFILFCTAEISAQSVQSGLNQPELMKKLIGTWKNDSNKDTVYTAEFKPYGNSGLEFSLRSVSEGKQWLDMKQLWGYDKRRDKVIIAGIMKNSPGVILQAGWFKSESRLEQVPYEFISDPGKATFVVIFEFKSPDQVTRQELVNGKSLGVENYNRIKD